MKRWATPGSNDIIKDMTETLLFGVILLQVAYSTYIDYANRKERADLELKLMAKSLEDYKSATDSTPQETLKQESDPYLDLDDAGTEQILKAREK